MTEETAARSIRALILELRDEAVTGVAKDGPLSAVDAARMQKRLEALLADPALAASLSESLTEYGSWSYEQGVRVIDDLIAGVPLPETLALPAANIDIAGAYITGSAGAVAITKIPEALLGQVRRSISLAFMGQRTPWEAQQAILRDFSMAANRAETIVRTELGRLANIGTQTRITDVAPKIRAAGIGMVKKWKHSSGMATPAGRPTPGARERKGFQRAKVRQNYEPRPHHKALHDTAVEPDGLFDLVHPRTGERWLVKGPYDDILPASEIVNCHCNVSLSIKRESATAKL